MRVIVSLFGILFPVFLSVGVQALALGPKECAAAKNVTCVMAQDSLGYLSEDDFNDLIDEALSGFEGDAGDVIYAKAVGYFDGLMFGIPESDQDLVQARLRQFNTSRACTQLVSSNFQL